MTFTAGGSHEPPAFIQSLVGVIAFLFLAAFLILMLLLIVMALLEVGTGVALLIAPSLIVRLLLHEGLSSPQSIVLGRITGAALISIGVACWLAAQGESSGYIALVKGMLIYNSAVPALLFRAALAFRLRGIALWPAVVIHAAFAAWCAICVLRA